MINALQSIWNLDRNSLYASVRSHLTNLSLFLFIGLLFTSKFWCWNAFISLTQLDPCIMMAVWRYSWAAVKMFYSYQYGGVQTPIL